MNHLNIAQPQFQHTLVQKPGFLAIAIKQGKAFFGEHNGQRDTGQTATGANIQQMIGGYPRQDTQAVE